ncbi:MAG: HAD family hydrolase [Promethearchaeota archaeon]
MKEYYIPGYYKGAIKEHLTIENLFLDLNGTINYYGKRPEGLKEYIDRLKEFFNIYIISANTRGDLDVISSELGVGFKQTHKKTSEQDAKLDILNDLGAERTIVIGNGTNDAKALERAAVGILVIGEEGASRSAYAKADIIVTNIFTAFKIILDESALKATLRN